jgi:hypothetical protein
VFKTGHGTISRLIGRAQHLLISANRRQGAMKNDLVCVLMQPRDKVFVVTYFEPSVVRCRNISIELAMS